MSSIWYEAEQEAKAISGVEEIDSHERRNIIEGILKKKVTELTERLVDGFNTMGSEDVVREGMFDGIQRSHRYLQGEFWKGMLKVIKNYGENKHFDARNEFAVKMCKRMGEAGEKW